MGFGLLSLGWSVVESEKQQRWEGSQRVQPSSNPQLRIEFQHELMPLCLRECNINGFHGGWKGHCTKNVGQLCDVETTQSGNFLRNIVLKCNVNVQIVNIIVLAGMKWLLCNSEGLKVPGNEKCLFCSVTLWPWVYCSAVHLYTPKTCQKKYVFLSSNIPWRAFSPSRMWFSDFWVNDVTPAGLPSS